MSEIKNKKYKLGIALSGGGVRGFAHLGVIKALKEKGIEANIYSGTSAGSISGVLLASGYSPKEAFDLMKDKGFLKYSKARLPAEGFFCLEGLRKELMKVLKVKKLEKLQIPLIVAATNLNKGIVEYFDKGPIEKIVLASASIPILYEPVHYKSYQYVDGGVLDNLPIFPLKSLCEKIIAVNVCPIEETANLSNMIQITSRVFHLSVGSRNYIHKPDIMIEPEGIHRYDLLNIKYEKEIYDLGYQYTKSLKIDI